MSVKAADPSQSSSDVTLLKIKLSKLETELKSKILEMAEKDGMLESMESENCVLKEELEKIKESIQIKDKVIEADLCKINTLEEQLKIKSDRVSILEPVVNRILNNTKTTDSIAIKTPNVDVTKLKEDLKLKSLEIKQLMKDKKEVNELQDKLNTGDNNDALEKCTKING